jgi:hypothetical protein
MADDGALGASHVRKRRSRNQSKRKNRKRQNLLYNLRWLLAGLAMGLPLLTLVIYMASRY